MFECVLGYASECVCAHLSVRLHEAKITAQWNAFPIRNTDAVWPGLMKVNISGYAIWASACMCVCLCACVCAYVVLMFWMSIGGKTCVENSAELRQGSHKSLSLSLALVFSFPSPLSRFALSTMRLLWWLAVVWDSSPPCLFSTHRCDKLLSRCLQVCGVSLFIPLCLLSVYFQWYLCACVHLQRDSVLYHRGFYLFLQLQQRGKCIL